MAKLTESARISKVLQEKKKPPAESRKHKGKSIKRLMPELIYYSG
jgi:hypothetical protein